MSDELNEDMSLIINGINERHITPVLCPVVAHIASYASKQIIKYILGNSYDIEVLNKRVIFDFKTDERKIIYLDLVDDNDE